MGVIGGDAIGMDVGNLGPEKLNVRIYFALKVEFKGKYGGAKPNDIGCNGSISSLNGGIEKLVELTSLMLFRSVLSAVWRTASVMSLPTWRTMALVAPSFAPMTA